MHTKGKSYTRFIHCLAALVFILSACKKETPAVYSGENFLYFMNSTVWANPDATTISSAYRPGPEFTFFVSRYNRDTIKTNFDFPELPLLIQTDGRVSDKDRTILLEVEGNGKDYVVLPHPDSIFIKANEIQCKVNLKFVKPPATDTSVKLLTLVLKTNDHFKPEHHTWSRITYKFGNWFGIPRAYLISEPYYGEFSAAKMQALAEAVNRKEPSYWENDPNVIMLNNFLQLRNEKRVKFDPFTFYDLYQFIDVLNLISEQPTDPLRMAYDGIARNMVSLAKELIIEKKNAGTPVLDASGKEISFP